MLTITQDDYINTAVHMNRPAASRTGDPLEINIVCVTAADLKLDCNDRLAPGEGITSDVWFQDRPISGDKADMDDRAGRFYLPKSQIFVMTYDKQFYGTKAGTPLRGAATDKEKTLEREFEFSGGLHNDQSVIYVFGKFIGPDGRVMAVPPAELHPPGAYTRDLFVRIGVDSSREFYGQYIDNETPRKLHGKEED